MDDLKRYLGSSVFKRSLAREGLDETENQTSQYSKRRVYAALFDPCGIGIDTNPW